MGLARIPQYQNQNSQKGQIYTSSEVLYTHHQGDNTDSMEHTTI